MAHDPSLYLRRACIARLKTAPAPPLPAARIYPLEPPPNPVKPFVQWGFPTVESFRASCLDGAVITATFHVFAATLGAEGDSLLAPHSDGTPLDDSTLYNVDDPTDPGETQAANIAAWIGDVLGEAVLDLVAEGACPYPAEATMEWVRTITMRDGNAAGAFHSVVTLRATVSA